MIGIRNVSQIYRTRAGDVEALRDVSLEVADGEFVAIVGRSGCGKSSLLRLVAGLQEATSGEITVAGTPIRGPRRDIGFMFQRPALLPWRSVIDNVLLPTEVFRQDRRDARNRAHELLDLVGLNGFEKRLPHELSGGMQQRVSLCRALIQQPRVLLMDEPFSALDALTRADLTVELQRLQMKHASTVLFVTHSVDEAVLLADRVVVLSPRPGRLRQIVDIDIARPRSLGRDGHSAELGVLRAQLHDLLMTPEEVAR
ncbi:ABC transporter ATP-binding protein [Micromonospora peucetia]|uniref:ABC transporter ATP-binding protein n=1 Tax=Micromonospora peucetia TaxID=47871 RepID=A0A1C6W6C0_9ACTN|nr:ABC transporter ATP-binding protein [Micromonospora peucetia]MCX4385719.1 ABC transporter ATP-binding protein [Micromonospora peucetia]WSA33097.1 ABC transporter ATP-binding protein [Micromonospora peucetia]SCL74115.1 NitT/TauT family transport system ATP-binding protein [Micromonospora peucetia]